MGDGGKAKNLRELAAIAPVPPFVVCDDTAATGKTAAEIADRSGLVPPYAVRSSADVEDGADAAFAGMFETRLDVSRDELPDAVRDVIASVTSPRVDAYVAATGSDPPRRVRAVVQTMVDARVAGVCATRLPESQPDCISIEAGWGLGETLVSGEISPDRIEVDRGTLVVTRVRPAPQLVELRVGKGRKPIPPHRRQARKLSDDQARAVAELALRVEGHFGWRALDLEWAFDESRLWALQARPVASMERSRSA